MKRYRLRNEADALESYGLPHMHIFLIFMVLLIVSSFLTWSNYVKLDESLLVSGMTIQENGEWKYIGYADTSKITKISMDNPVMIYYEGNSEETAVWASIEDIDRQPFIDNNRSMYQITFITGEQLYSENYMEGMEVNIVIKVGERTLLQYLMGYLYDAVRIKSYE